MEIVVIWFLFGIVAAVVATNKGRNGCGWFVLGVLLGPFGFILSLVVPKNQAAVEQEAIDSGGLKKCPYCAELIKAEAIKCRYCATDLLQPTNPSTPESPDPVFQRTIQCRWCGSQVYATADTCYVYLKRLSLAIHHEQGYAPSLVIGPAKSES